MTDQTIADRVNPGSETTEDLGWAIVELMGHRRLAGYCSEQVVAGAAMLRIDVCQDPPVSQLYSAGAVYCITPTTEAMCRAAMASRGKVEPVTRWELERANPEPEPADAETVDGDPRVHIRKWFSEGRSDAWIAHQLELHPETVKEMRTGFDAGEDIPF